MQRLRVLMLSTDLQKGGLPLRLVRLARHLPHLGVEPIVGCLRGPGPLSDELSSAGIETFSCDAAGPFDATCLARFAEHVKRINPDLIHSSLFHANLAARLVGRRDRPRPILSSTVTIEIERPWHRWIESLTAGMSDGHVANSEAVARHLEVDLGFSLDRISVIPNGLDITEIDQTPPIERQKYGIDSETPVILWAGRMDPVKNLETFIEVIAQIQHERRVHAVLLGEGPATSNIKRLVETKGLSRFIFFAGWSDQVIGWLKAADILLFPSWTEGSPNVVLEAMACQCPVVASDVPACSELIDSGKAGILCPPDQSGLLAQSVRMILENRPFRERLIISARRRVLLRHDIQDVVCRWRKTYERLVAVFSR